MTRRKITSDSLRADAAVVADWIKATNGRRSVEVQNHFNFGRDYSLQVLKAASAFGIKKHRVTHCITLYLTERERQRRLAESAEQQRLKNLERKRRSRAASDDDDQIDWQATQRIAPAAEPLPFVVNAPRSVFEWGIAA